MKKIIIAKHIWTLVGREVSALNRTNLYFYLAKSNHEILDIHRTQKADLIITGLNMPDMDGDKLCDNIRRDRNLNKVSIVLVSSGSPSDIERSTRSKANIHLAMPVNAEALICETFRLLNIAKREAFRVLVTAKVKGKVKGATFLCNLVNLSKTGILIETSKDLSVDDKISCSFFLRNAGQITVNGVIVRIDYKTVDLREYGIRFQRLSQETMAHIESFIREKTRST